MVLLGQHRGEHLHRRDVDPARGQVVEDHREPPHRPRRGDAVVRGVLGEMEMGAAVLVDRAPAFTEIGLAPDELGEMRDQLHRRAALLEREDPDAFEQRVRGQLRGSE